MMLYALVADDKPDGLKDRLANRPEHLKYLESLGDRLILAGPFLDQNGDSNGTIAIIEAANQGEAEKLFKQDPFIVKGVFGAYQVRPFKITINNLKA
jgi:uncharacterized protein YciI